MAASNPMIATTIMISTRVKPDLRFVLIRILLFFVSVLVGVNKTGSGYIILRQFVHVLLHCQPTISSIAARVPLSGLQPCFQGPVQYNPSDTLCFGKNE